MIDYNIPDQFLNFIKSKEQFKRMGGQNAKQPQGESPIQIEHPRFQGAKVIQQKGTAHMVITMGIQEKQYNKWKHEISTVKSTPQYLLTPTYDSFSTKGFCGSSGTLTVAYEYFPYLLIQELQNRRKRKSKFQQCELWFLLFSLSAAQIQMKKIFNCKVGDIRPQNIFINQQGQIKVSCMYSWPRQSSNFQKTFQHQQTLLAPQDMNKLQLGGMDDIRNYQSQMFSIGMTILSAAMLTDFRDVYDVKKFKFRFQQANDYLQEWRANTTYSQIFTAFISNLCSFQPQKRLTEKQLWSWINKYEQQIKSKDDFFIQHAPVKIQKQIQQLRGQSNINILQQPNRLPPGMMQSTQQNMPFQQKSIVFPFMQGLPQQRFTQQSQIPQMNIPQNMQRPMIPPLNTTGMSMNPPPNMVMSPRQSIQATQIKPMVQSMHPNIPTAQSMYTQIPPDLYANDWVKLPPGQFSQLNPRQPPPPEFTKLPPQIQGQMQGQFPIIQGQIPGQLPPGVLSARGIPQNGFQQGAQRIITQPQQFMPPNMMMPNSPTNGNFVYTRRIIDTKNNTVVAQQTIGQHQYQRGVGQQPQQGDY